jgi:hypothetical protein
LADYATIAGIAGAIGVMAVGELVKRSSKKASTQLTDNKIRY